MRLLRWSAALPVRPKSEALCTLSTRWSRRCKLAYEMMLRRGFVSEQNLHPTPTDPHNIKETLCDGPFNIVVAGPLAYITFTHVRPEVGALFKGAQSSTAVVASRIAIPINNLFALRDVLSKLLPTTGATAVPPTSATGGTRH